MQLIRLGAAVLNQTPFAWEQNKANILRAIALAKAEGAGILCLPEMCVTGYGVEDSYHSPGLLEMAWRVVREILPATEGIVVTLGMPLLYRNALFNTACLAANGAVHGFVAKRVLAGDGIHYEPRWFKAWPPGVRGEVALDGRTYPVGDVWFNCGGVRIGFEICEDAWVATRPGGYLAQMGVDVILNPSASHFAFGKFDVRKRFVLEGSRAFSVSYVYSNLVGNESGRAIYDGGAIIASGGHLLAAGPRFCHRDVVLTTADVDLHATRMTQARTASFKPMMENEPENCVRVDFEFPRELPPARREAPAAWESGEFQKEEEFARSVALGLFDYMRKSRSEGFVVSLSGGADSAATASLVAMMLAFAEADLGGFDALRERLAYSRRLSGAAEHADLLRELLLCAYQRTENSTQRTLDAARAVASGIGAEFLVFDVGPIVKAYVSMVEGAIGRALSWEGDDTALQNIQARVRAPGAWMLANLRNALLLSTSNRSEAAVGYATMDGDTCGGLSPIAGIDKAFLLEWLKWAAEKGPEGFGPIRALRAVTALPPTAELRPPESGQTDEADLMPYPILDEIERAAIRDKRTPLEVFRLLSTRHRDLAPQTIAEWVERFFRLWCRNQWKRERYAPSFHLDDESLDPKTWCRFPILSGGMARELDEMHAHVRALEGKR